MATGLISLLGIILLIRLGPVPTQFGFPGFQVPVTIAFGGAGMAILRSRPGNRIGEVLLINAVCTALQFAVQLIPPALEAIAADASSVAWASWVGNWIWVPSVVTIALLFAYFPDGRMASPRWARLVPLILVAGVVAVILQMIAPGPLFNFPRVVNPIGLAWAGGAQYVGYLAILAALGLAAVSLLGRWRRSQGEAREQLKWIAFAGVPVAVGGVLAVIVPVGSYLMIAGGMAIPIAIAVAVLRYRLYDIDHLVSRTFVYGALTAILAGVYTAALKLFNELFVQVTGAGSDGAVILATLVLAAAFTPVRKGLEGIIDRRFKPPASNKDSPASDARHDDPALEELLRRVIREELASANAPRSRSPRN